MRTGADMVWTVAEVIGPPGTRTRRLSGLSATGGLKLGTWIPPCTLLHRRSLTDRIGGWGNWRELALPVDLELLDRAKSSGGASAGIPSLTAFKFPSTARPNSYREQPHHEQAACVRRIESHRGFLVTELARALARQAIPPARAPAFRPRPDAPLGTRRADQAAAADPGPRLMSARADAPRLEGATPEAALPPNWLLRRWSAGPCEARSSSSAGTSGSRSWPSRSRCRSRVSSRPRNSAYSPCVRHPAGRDRHRQLRPARGADPAPPEPHGEELRAAAGLVLTLGVGILGWPFSSPFSHSRRSAGRSRSPGWPRWRASRCRYWAFRFRRSSASTGAWTSRRSPLSRSQTL